MHLLGWPLQQLLYGAGDRHDYPRRHLHPGLSPAPGGSPGWPHQTPGACAGGEGPVLRPAPRTARTGASRGGEAHRLRLVFGGFLSGEGSFDLAVLGSGPGGYVAAIRAAQLGQKVAVIEDDRPGGVCLNWGCIPSKALLTGAELVENLRSHGDTFGIGASGITLDYDKLITHSRKTADRLSKGIESLFRKNKITLVRGHGRLSAATRVDVT